eukprot:1879079-Rhodomonas_salina.1
MACSCALRAPSASVVAMISVVFMAMVASSVAFAPGATIPAGFSSASQRMMAQARPQLRSAVSGRSSLRMSEDVPAGVISKDEADED